MEDIEAEESISNQNIQQSQIRPWLASLMLTSILHSNPACKSLALKIQLASPDGPVSLINYVAQKFISLADTQIENIIPQQKQISHPHSQLCSGYLSLLATWLHDHSPSVSEFLAQSASIQYLFEILQPGSSIGADPLIKGLSSFVITILYQFNDDNTSPFASKILRTFILKRVGSDQIFNAASKIRSTPSFRDVHPWYEFPETYSLESTPSLDQYKLDYSFVEFFKQQFGNLIIRFNLKH
ncbi:hypothetical protein K502DRAFT_184243 [Neoconidiobolus thromboides FSU 785]|nr:hypothetical protein K502DRAFT_184243 [Neoconidiobolus thromboides FSU 785]